MNRTTEEIARDMITGLFAELAELCDATNDDRLSAWEMARQKAAEVFHATDTVCFQMYARRGMEAPALPASTRIYLDGRPKVNHRDIPTETPEEAEELDRIEQGGGLHPLMADLISPFVQRKLA